jgi:uridine monophosphate synthetase
MKELIVKLHSIGAIKFGNFEIKKDFFAPFQIDFSVIISNPLVAKAVCAALYEKAQHFTFDLICGVPLFGACLANYIAWEKELQLVLRRQEVKGKMHKIEGSYKTGQSCLILQDLCISGQHTLETIEDLEEEGIKVSDSLAFVDYELGGKKKIKGRGYVPHAVIGMKEVIQILHSSGKVGGDHLKLASDFLENV